MRRGFCASIAVVGVLAFGAAGCGGDDDDVKVETRGVMPDDGQFWDLDNQLDQFLTNYVAENEMFADDPLDYDVAKGVVVVRGTVDSEAEREALVQRVRQVPGVREVDVSNLTILP